MFRDFPHRGEKGRNVHNVQLAEAMNDMGINMPRIYAAFDNKQAKYQSHMIKVEGMINNHPFTILIDSWDIHSYIDPRVVESLQLSRIKHEKYCLV